MNQTEIHLDTTAIADRLFESAAVRDRILAILDGRTVKASRYVREQLRATFLRAAVLLYNSLLDSADIAEVIRKTDKFEFFTQGEGAKARKILSRLLESPKADLSDKMVHLERLIEFDLMMALDSLAQLVDDTACCQCPEEPTRTGEGRYRFKKQCNLKEPRPCSIERFWRQREAGLRRLANANPAGANRTITQAILAAKDVVTADHLPRGQRCYVNLSDAVIVAEANPNSSLLTSNVKDFEPLSAIFGEGRTIETYKEDRDDRK